MSNNDPGFLTLPCPRCGMQNSETTSGPVNYVKCKNCQYIGPEGKDRETAQALWNSLSQANTGYIGMTEDPNKAIQPIGPRHSYSRGWVLARSDTMRADDALAEWGHFTPRFPVGIANKTLEREPISIQRETALFWFHSNLILWDQMRGGPWFAFDTTGEDAATNTAGLGIGKLTPSLFNAISVLTAEFGGTLPEDLISVIADELPGKWEWPNAPPPITPQPIPAPEIIVAVQAALDQLKQAIAGLSAAPGVLGHNGLAGGVTLEDAEVASIQIDELQAVLDQPTPDLKDVRSRWERIWRWVGSLVQPAVKLIAEGGLREGGKDLLDGAHHLYLTWGVGQYAGSLLERLLSALGGS